MQVVIDLDRIRETDSWYLDKLEYEIKSRKCPASVIVEQIFKLGILSL